MLYGGKINLFSAGMVSSACFACVVIGVLFLWRRRNYRSTSFYFVFCGLVLLTFGTLVGNFTAMLGLAGIIWMPDAFMAGRVCQVVGIGASICATSYGQPNGLRAATIVIAFSILGGIGALFL